METEAKTPPYALNQENLFFNNNTSIQCENSYISVGGER